MTGHTLYGWFHATVARHGDATALEVDDLELSYTELDKVVARVAATIERTARGRPRRVGLLTTRSLMTYAGYLAILRLGASVVPMNPRNPVARNVLVTADAALDACLVDDSSGYWRANYVEQAGTAIVDMSGGRWRAALADTADAAEIAEPSSDIAYIVFTSGSTGRPKGVPIAHDNISAFIAGMLPRFLFTPGCRVAQTFELSFDAAVQELFGAWASGGTLCVPRHRDVFNPVPFVTANRITHWSSTSSMVSFGIRQGSLAPGSMPSLRLSVLGAEPLSRKQALAWQEAAPNATVYNCYGPTELTLVCTAYTLGAPDEWPVTSNDTVPIGEVYPGLDALLLDDEGQPASDGELCVRGAQRFPGYLDPTDNIGRFVSFDGLLARGYDGSEPLSPAHYYRTGDRVRREHGELVHLGRVDTQLKIHGFRVEPGEIEAVLARHPDVTEVVVVAVATEDGAVDLHACYTGGTVPQAEFAELAAALPLYMRPRGYHHRAAIPLTDSGKVDRGRLGAEVAV